MIQKTITYNLLSFEELSEEQKQQVLDKYRDIETDCLTAEDYLDIGDVYTIAVEQGFLDTEWYWDINYCQGRGACFDCTKFDFVLLLKDLNIPHKARLLKILDNLDYGIRRPDSSFAYHYSHERCRYFYLNPERYVSDRLDKVLRKIENHIEQKRYKLCIEACARITDVYEGATSDEHITEFLKANEYLFNENTLQVEEA